MSGVWVAELGGQVAAGNRLFLEASGFVEIYGTGAATSGGTRFFMDSPGARGGIRLYLGFDL